MYKDYLITIFSYKDKEKDMFRGYAKNMKTGELINPIVNGNFLVAESYNEILNLVKDKIDEKEEN